MYLIKQVPKTPKTNEEIKFSEKDLLDVQTPHDDALVIHPTIVDFGAKRVLLNTGSVVDILFPHA